MNFVPQKVKDLFFKVLKSNSSTKSIADGFGLGLFVGFLPIMGIQMYVVFLLTSFLKKNQIVAMLAVWVSNPLTFIPLYYFNFKVGQFVYHKHVDFDFNNLTWKTLLEAGSDIIVPLSIGSVIVGIVAGIIGRFLCLRYYDTIKKRFSKKQPSPSVES